LAAVGFLGEDKYDDCLSKLRLVLQNTLTSITTELAKGRGEERTRGSHHQYRHPIKRGLVTVAGNRNDEIAPGTLNSILKQAALKK
jgi:predicted RNA binding protein YcfA (HicA-like mRNA interferase family)